MNRMGEFRSSFILILFILLSCLNSSLLFLDTNVQISGAVPRTLHLSGSNFPGRSLRKYYRIRFSHGRFF